MRRQRQTGMTANSWKSQTSEVCSFAEIALKPLLRPSVCQLVCQEAISAMSAPRSLGFRSRKGVSRILASWNRLTASLRQLDTIPRTA